MSYGYVYVAQVAMGYDAAQTVKAIKEAVITSTAKVTDGVYSMWLKDEELRLMCGHKPQWKNRSVTERADPGSLTFNKENLGYIQMRYDNFRDKKNNEFHSVINMVADRINLISHNGADTMGSVSVTEQRKCRKFCF